eukprot:CAMPEP_0203786436 /NCGR_PEP_ID=MMETSP0100_2-20121128/1626_1 /ASSEMBLY_ACC=CAM_ASM_000210 /TAXON_ID=96639 /ORGANISM=" , Strain NY0313808BC1" /LENGTH=158 /DNA_ID=CAMNT_0050688739 /DNA_START=959 /DNA_END=1435 /DNA_ORIENTATION=+
MRHSRTQTTTRDYSKGQPRTRQLPTLVLLIPIHPRVMLSESEETKRQKSRSAHTRLVVTNNNSPETTTYLPGPATDSSAAYIGAPDPNSPASDAIRERGKETQKSRLVQGPALGLKVSTFRVVAPLVELLGFQVYAIVYIIAAVFATDIVAVPVVAEV